MVKFFLQLRRAGLFEKIGPRNLKYYHSLTAAADYIKNIMLNYGCLPELQKYFCEKKSVHNIIAEKPGAKCPQEIIVVGAHYDTVLDSPGADDNATGIAALLELIRLLQNYPAQRTLRLVAFTLEEPPFFNSPDMGSMVYASACRKNNDNIFGMIALEMLGYFTDEPMSQSYPIKEMLFAYPERGNFIGVVGNRESENFTEKFAEYLKQTSQIKVEKLIGDAAIPGVDLSDHASFWKNGFPALMITDTAFFRNIYYHTAEDKIDHLNFSKFSKLTAGLAEALKIADQQL